MEDLTHDIKSRSVVRDVFEFSDGSDYHLTGFYSIANAGEIGYFNVECKCNPIIEFFLTLTEDVLVY